MSKPKPTVGQTLYSLNVGNAARRTEQKLTPVVVKSVGRKYFVCGPENGSKFQESKFTIEDWRKENGGYSADACLYGSEQAWIDEKESKETFRFISEQFRYPSSARNFSLGALREIEAILKREPTVSGGKAKG